jgi:hypothetical protein
MRILICSIHILFVAYIFYKDSINQFNVFSFEMCVKDFPIFEIILDYACVFNLTLTKNQKIMIIECYG